MSVVFVRGELSQDQVEPLRTQLLQLISNFAAGPRIVLNRLCIAVSCSLLFAYNIIILCCSRYRDGAGNTVEENYSVSLVRMR